MASDALHQTQPEYHVRNGVPKQSGSALMVVLGLLILLALIGTTFLATSTKEQGSSVRLSAEARAEMLAESGLEHVLDPSEAEGIHLSSRYRGEDYNNNQELDGNSLPNGRGEDGNGNQNSDLNQRVSPKYALYPSFAIDRNEDGTPDLFRIRKEGKTYFRSASGALPSSRGGNDTYTLRVIDNNTKLNINSLNPAMGRMIDRLYRELTGNTTNPGTEKIIGPPDKVETSKDDFDDDGVPERRSTSKYRPPLFLQKDSLNVTGGYSSVQQLQNVLSPKEYRVLKKYLTISEHNWTDTSVVKPNPQQTNKAGHLKDPNNPASAFSYNFDYRLQPRAPIRVNRAPVELLTAAIQGLKARAMVVENVTNDSGGKAVHTTKTIGPITEESARESARKIQDYTRGIGTINFREPKYNDRDDDGDRKDDNEISRIQTWQEFEALVDQKLVDEGILTAEEGYLLKANFQPNTRIAKFNYNKPGIWSWQKDGKRFFLDKTDFLYHTTEFCLHSSGYFSVDSYGRITNASNEPVANAHLKSVIKKFDITKHTTQRDFIVNEHTDASEGGSRKMTTYPESVSNITRTRARNGTQTGTDFGGQITIAPRTLDSSAPNRHYWSFDDPDQFTTSEDAPRYMSRTLPYGHQSREYNDVSGDSTSQKHGLISGTTDRSEASNYPNVDPYNYSDVTPEGLLLGSDRNRVIRFPTHNDAFPNERWKEGHLEFWWKPKQPINIQENTGTRETLWWDWFQQHLVKSSRITFFEQFFLAPSADIRIPHYKGTKYGKGWAEHLWLLDVASVDDFQMHSLTVPEDQRRYADWKEGNAAGFFHKFWIQNGHWYFLIRFRSAFMPRKNTWDGRRRNHIDAGNILGGAVLASMPVDQAQPKVGQWNRIVLKWRPLPVQDPESIGKPLKYITNGTAYSNDQDFTEPRNPSLVTPTFWVNSEKSTDIKVWGEGNLKGTMIWMSNFGTAEDGNQKSIGEMHAGYPPNWWEAEDQRLILPTMLGPKRLDKYYSYGFLGGKIQRRGDKGGIDGVLEPDAFHQDWWHSFVEGTMDEIIYTGSADNANMGEGMIANRYYSSSGGASGSPRFTGRMYRDDPGKWGSDREKHNNYARVKQRILKENPDQEIEIVKLAHTQYRPEEDWSGNSISEKNRPFFKIEIKSEGGSYLSAPDQWLGAPASAKRLFGEPVILSPDESYFQYRLTPKNANFSPQNITPHFHELTIMHRPRNKSGETLSLYYK